MSKSIHFVWLIPTPQGDIKSGDQETVRSLASFGLEIENMPTIYDIFPAVHEKLSYADNIEASMRVGFRYAIAMNGNRIIGVNCFRPKGWGSNGLLSFFTVVHPDFQGQRVGEKLKYAVRHYALENGFRYMRASPQSVKGIDWTKKGVKKKGRTIYEGGKKTARVAERHRMKGRDLVTTFYPGPHAKPTVRGRVRNFLKRFTRR